jgi:homoserine dehydrogenase
MRFRLVLVGFGRVAQNLAKILIEKRTRLKRQFDFDYKVVAVVDTIKGSAMRQSGLHLERLLSLAQERGSIKDYPEGTTGLSAIETIARTDSDVLVEATWTNLEDGEPGLSHIRKALSKGLHVVTTNKGPIALAYHGLAALARRRRCHLRFEGTVLSGTPAISLGTEALAGSTINSIRGILNGTTNYILDEMAAGRTYTQALKTAQELGYAEADPSSDLEAWDSAAKITILVNVLMGGRIKPTDVRRQGITGITPEDIGDARTKGERIRLVANAYRDKDRIRAQVIPERLEESDLLSHVSGVLNAMILSTDVQPEVAVVGPGAGGESAGYALLSDLLALNRTLKDPSRIQDVFHSNQTPYRRKPMNVRRL